MLTISEFLQENSFPAISLFENADNEAIHVNGASVPLASMMVANRFLKSPQNILVIAKDYRSAEVWVENLESMVGEEFVRFFPSLGLKPYEIKVPFEGVLEERLKFFRDISHTEKPTPGTGRNYASGAYAPRRRPAGAFVFTSVVP